jgi:hypothetical protein
MKGKYLKMRERAPRHVYTVHGTSKEVADFIEKQGENCRYLQTDGSIGADETSTPVVYQFKNKGNTPTLVWNAEYENWDARINWMDAMVMDKFLTDAEGITPNEQNDEESDEETVAVKPKGVVKKIGKK